jgi:hypothetical protein
MVLDNFIYICIQLYTSSVFGVKFCNPTNKKTCGNKVNWLVKISSFLWCGALFELQGVYSMFTWYFSQCIWNLCICQATLNGEHVLIFNHYKLSWSFK